MWGSTEHFRAMNDDAMIIEVPFTERGLEVYDVISEELWQLFSWIWSCG